VSNPASGRHRGPRALGAAVLVTAVGLIAPPPAVAAGSGRSDTIVMAVTDVTPSTPTTSTRPHSLAVSISLTNTTGRDIPKVQIRAERGDPIGTQGALDDALAHPNPPSTPGLEIKPAQPVSVDLPAGSSVDTTFLTTTSVLDDGKGICLCAVPSSIYPLFFSAHITGKDGVDQRLGVVATYLPAFYTKPAPVRVAWLWPLIDRPHRLADDTVFMDDDLAALVEPDGRLSRALAVVEAVGDTVPLTLVIDPELLDELEVMATGKYSYRTGATTSAGTGQGAATSWLDRLRTALTADPAIEVELTPYADPDVESLSQYGLDWSTTMPDEMATRVTQALAGRDLAASVAWPAAGALGPNTLDALVQAGASTVVLNASAVSPRQPEGSVPAGIARLEGHNQDVAAVLLSPAVQKDAAAAVTLGGSGTGALPALISELAIRAVQEPKEEHAAVIAAPRYVDPSVAVAARAIRETSSSPFSKPTALHSIMGATLLPTGRSKLAKVPASAAALPAQNVQTASALRLSLATLTSLFGSGTGAAQTLLGSLPIAVQRVESSAWRKDPHSANQAIGEAYAQDVDKIVRAISTGVHIVSPSSGSYTLASSNSQLPITVENDLDYPVNVRVQVTTVNGLPGFSAKDIGSQRIDPNSKRTLHLPTRVDRSGRIQVQAVLRTPSGDALGAPVVLSVHSTALGVVGVVITIVAGVVLALALLVRLARRVRHRRKPRAAPPAAVAPDPTPDPAPGPVPTSGPTT
jgi:hypothetical protein